MKNIDFSPELAVSHLNGEVWEKVNRLHIKKAICEFAHELLISPELQYKEGETGHYVLRTDHGAVEYRFEARKLHLDHWSIDEESIRKFDNGDEVSLDSLKFVTEFRESLGIPVEMLPTYMEEITSTLYGAAFMHTKEQLNAVELVEAGYQDIEHAMMAGHPCFVANNGRIGFDASDYRAFAPEACAPVKLIWVAGHKSRATYAGIEKLPYETLMAQELGRETVDKFNAILDEKGLDKSEYYFIPVHPWQWFNKLAHIFATDIADGKLVCLGYASDEYLAQQSIRTFYNISDPEKHYTKTALSILNMGFMRGLSPYYMSSTPAIMEWITELLGDDAYLRQKGFTMLGEVASIGYRNHYYEELGRSLAYNKMLSALWRESPATVLQPGQKLMTMAALLHIDVNGNALVPELIRASGLEADAWLAQYIDCYMSPLLHCFYAYDMVFMPHGENLILILENNVPVKVIMKDITEEVAILSPDVALPEKVKRLYASTPDDIRLLSIFTDVFDCFFRFLSAILVEQAQYDEERFWKLVAQCIQNYQDAHPDLSDKFEQYDLFAPEFTRSCLNRLQLRNNQQMVDLANPSNNLQFFGTLKNPVAAYQPVRTEVV
ncbi:IucA/IucC family siderophore biosynthesis protein [Fulvivirga sp. 29W222]|uniref:IucA/IucC family siderophore biosynthesis protein n=1 Tax=Fulvivirga marina TaxID=2494733 RepID=A0A937G0E3_9BACT|nr:IucA/IucC family siderophore biosynthesis protein [Fulvivirga marina]MBL6447831.1 IucA/IucC family siderophore biosynthesis protein [Fulvivirga marina]QHG11730.1 putative ATP-dependent siderophore synthetase [Fulvivirga marina]